MSGGESACASYQSGMPLAAPIRFPPARRTGPELSAKPPRESREPRKAEQLRGLRQRAPFGLDVALRELDPHVVEDRRECLAARRQPSMHGLAVDAEPLCHHLAGGASRR